MSNVRMLIMSLCATLCVVGSYAQQYYVLSLEQMFALADENSKTVKAENAAVVEAQQAVREARIHLENAERNYNRFKSLYEQDAVTRQQYDDMHTAYLAAKARYEMLCRQKESVQSVSREQNTRLGQSEAGIKLAEAALELVNLNFSYTIILSPCGVVSGTNPLRHKKSRKSSLTFGIYSSIFVGISVAICRR